MSFETDIDAKVVQHVSFLTDSYNCNKAGTKFDFIIAKPQNESLNNAYQNALDLIDRVKIKKNFVLENQIESYSHNVISELQTI